MKEVMKKSAIIISVYVIVGVIMIGTWMLPVPAWLKNAMEIVEMVALPVVATVIIDRITSRI